MKSKKHSGTSNAPLLCWDIFMEGFHRRMQFASDIRIMKKIMTGNHYPPLPVSLDNMLIWHNKVIIITDNNINIVHATKNIFEMNGYRLQEIIGKSPKIFQGEATTAEERKIIKTAVENQVAFVTTITNYRKNGSVYKCYIEGYPVFNKKGILVNFIALEHAA